MSYAYGVGVADAKGGTDRGRAAAAAIRHLLAYLSKASAVTGYLPRKNPKTIDLIDEDGVYGRSVYLHAPRMGFSDHQRDIIELYSNSLTYWGGLIVDLDWEPDGVTIAFKAGAGWDSDTPPTWRERVRERFQTKTHRAAQDMAKTLVQQGFLAREPRPIQLLTLEAKLSGSAIMVKYPQSKAKDIAGIAKAYDKYLPMLADIFARELKLESDCIREGEITTVVFLRKRTHLGVLYDSAPKLKLLGAKGRGHFDLAFFTRSSYRACRMIAKESRKHFDLARRPVSAWGVVGHTLAIYYKPGAMGRIADDSYGDNIRKLCERAVKRFGVRAAVKQLHENRVIIVTFYTYVERGWDSFETVLSHAVVSREPHDLSLTPSD